jgi:membrane protease YdiL (CAAX protease family)
VVSGFLFAYYHYVGARQIGLLKERSEIVLVMIDNTWGGLIFGWLFWRYGLVTAMISHALFHLVWYPIERHIHRRDHPDGRTFQAE